MAARSRGPPRSSVRRESARERSGAAASSARSVVRRSVSASIQATASRRAAIAAGSVDGPASRRASSRAPAPVTVRSMAASRLPSPLAGERRRQLEIGARRGVDQHGVAGALADRRGERRVGADLRLLDIGERRRGRREFDAAEAAEAVEAGDAEIAPVSRSRRGRAVEEGGGQRRHARSARPRQKARQGRRRRRARRRPAPRAARCGRGRRRAARARSARCGTRRSRCRSRRWRSDRRRRPPRSRAIAARKLLRPGASSASSVSVPGVTRRMTSRRTTALAPRFRASAGSSICSQTATRWPRRDQLLQILVGGVDRHAAHRDVGALVLAALGERDAEGARGDLGVVEEHLVEIAHPVEEQAIGIGGLDLEVLRHHRRRRRRRRLAAGGIGARRAGIDGAARLADARTGFDGRRPSKPPDRRCRQHRYAGAAPIWMLALIAHMAMLAGRASCRMRFPAPSSLRVGRAFDRWRPRASWQGRAPARGSGNTKNGSSRCRRRRAG